MSSILEALKKLESEKDIPLPLEATVAATPDFTSATRLRDHSDPATPSRTMPALVWVLGGGMFTLMVIGVAVLFMMLLLQREHPSQTGIATSVAAIPVPPPAMPPTNTTAVPPAADGATTAPEAMVVTPVTLPKPAQETRPAPPPAPKPAPRPVKTPEARLPVANTEPIPADIRTLPMLTRTERTQYRLDGVQLNMLNVAGPTRPIGNAFINLEKVFIGEILPGSNAKLIGVKSYGIAIEIQSTGQRYYIPR